MIVRNFKVYTDGGTIEIETDKGIFCFDERIGTITKGKLFEGYPKEDNSNIIENYSELEQEIIESLKVYKSEFYQEVIYHLIMTK